MADIKNVFDIAARSMSAQMVRLNTVASNLANARSVASSEAEAYRAIKPVFKTIYADDLQKTGVSSVDVVDIVAIDRAPDKSYQPGHPKADKDGYIYTAAVDTEEEMVEMLEDEVRKLYFELESKDVILNNLTKYVKTKLSSKREFEEMRKITTGKKFDGKGIDKGKQKMLLEVLKSRKPIESSLIKDLNQSTLI